MNKINTKIFDWKNGIKEQELEEVLNVLQNDGVIIFPTDTVYGIACNCFSESAIEKIYKIKNRPKSKPINVLTDSKTKISQITKKITPKEKELVEKYMPGALTIIFDKNDKVPNILTSNLDTVGIRIPNNTIALEILKRFPNPLATTSANESGESEGVKLEDFISEFMGKVSIIIDGGETPLQISSTIVRVEEENIKVLRQGTVYFEENDLS